MREKLPATSKARSAHFKTWIRQAEYDIAAARLSRDNKYFEWSCFQAEQAVEKALKAVLVHAGWRPPKMHKLSVLMSYCNDANKNFKKQKFDFSDLEKFSFVARYPFLEKNQELPPHEFITLDVAKRCIDQAEGFLRKITKLLLE